MSKFNSGDVVIFRPGKSYNELPEGQQFKQYGSLKTPMGDWDKFVYICEINHSGHCVLISLSDKHIEIMRHICDFRLTTEGEW
jgi:hypothetical protein